MRYKDKLLSEIAASQPNAPAPVSTSRERVVIFKDKSYRKTPSDRLREHLTRAGWETEYLDPGLRPSLKDLKPITDHPPTAIIRWEEQGSLFKNRRWEQICQWCYANNVAPLSVDYGYFNHFRTLMLDRYMPDGMSAIADEWAEVPDHDIDWQSEADSRLQRYRNRIQWQWDYARDAMPPADPGYVAVFMQYSPALCRLRYQDASGSTPTERWARKVYDTLTAAGKRTVFKKSPLNPKGRQALPEDALVFDSIGVRSRKNAQLNLRIAAHASHIVMNCSSVASEFVLNDAPIVALGRSWFVRAPGVFAEPGDWRGIAEVPIVNRSARNKWIRWWLRHQGYGDEIAKRLDYVLDGFRKHQAKAPTIVSVPKRVRAILANDTLGAHKNHLGCRANSENLVQLLDEHHIDVAHRVRVGTWDKGIRERHKKQIANSDLLIINGEGSIHSDNKRAESLFKGAILAGEHGKPVWLVNHLSWGNDNLLKLYPACQYIAVRDITSYGYLAGFGIGSELAADCSFLSEPATAEREDIALVCAGLTAPPMKLCEQWANQLECRLVFCNDFYSHFKEGMRSKSIEESFKLFAKAKFVISSSYHGCVFAALHATPFIAVRFPKQPPKTMTMATEAMGFHTQRLSPEYIKGNYGEIVDTMHSRLDWYRHRAQLNIPSWHKG